MTKLKNVMLVGGLLAASLSANATVVSGTNLQAGLDALTEDGSFLDVNADQYNPDEVWGIDGSTVGVHHLIFEFASFQSDAKFGIYDVTDPTKKLELFDGGDCGGADGVLSGGNVCSVDDDITALFQVGTTFFYSNFDIPLTDPVTIEDSGSATFGSTNFGYYLDSSEGIFFSQSHLNTDTADAGHEGTSDHMIAFKGDGSEAISVDDTDTYADFAAGEFILAWEDLNFDTGSDYDYSDFVVLVESVQPVPEPGTLALLGLGLAGLGFSRRKVKA